MPTRRLARARRDAMVGVAGCPSLVVERTGARTGYEGGEGPQVASVGQTPVAGVAGQHTRCLPGALLMGDVPEATHLSDAARADARSAGHCRWSRSPDVPGHPPDLALEGPRRAYEQVHLSPVRSGDNALILTIGLSGALTAPLGSAETKSGVDGLRASELSHGGGVPSSPSCDEGGRSSLVHVCPQDRCRHRFRGSPRLAATGTPGNEDRGQSHQGCLPPMHGTSMHSGRREGTPTLSSSPDRSGSIRQRAITIGSPWSPHRRSGRTSWTTALVIRGTQQRSRSTKLLTSSGPPSG